MLFLDVSSIDAIAPIGDAQIQKQKKTKKTLEMTSMDKQIHSGDAILSSSCCRSANETSIPSLPGFQAAVILMLSVTMLGSYPNKGKDVRRAWCQEVPLTWQVMTG